MTVRYRPGPPPQIEGNDPLRVYLDSEFRKIDRAQSPDIKGAGLNGATDNVVINDTTETPIVNYTTSYELGIGANRVTGIITVPNDGLLRLSTWISLNQTTNSRDFTVQLVLEINGVWDSAILSSGYLPQQGSDVRLGLSAVLSRSVSSGLTLRLGLILDGTNSATFQIVNSAFQVAYVNTGA